MRTLFQKQLLILAIFLMMADIVYSQYERLLNFPSPTSAPTPSDATSAFNRALQPIQNQITEESGTIPSLDPSTTIDNAISPVTGIQGSNILKAKGLLLEGTAIKSVINSNFVPFYNLVDGSIVAFDLNKDQLVSVNQFLNKKFLNEFRTTLSKGAKFRQFFRNSDTVITFEATDDASVFINKDKTYTFEHGILTFRNSKITEKITTKEKTKATIDQELGITSMTLAKNASYVHENLEQREANLYLEYHDIPREIAVIKSSEARITENSIDFVRHMIQLKGSLVLKKKINNAFKPFYESFNQNNILTLVLDANNDVVTSLFLETAGSGLIANIYTSFYKINERKANVHKRSIEFTEESPLVEKYSSSLDATKVITLNKERELVQKKADRHLILAQQSSAYKLCSALLKNFLRYQDGLFQEQC